MASTLVKIKSETLLPQAREQMAEIQQDENDIHTKEELEKRLQEYLVFKKAGEKLGGMPKLWEQVFNRTVEPREVIRERILKSPEVTSLVEVYTDYLYRSSRKLVPIKSDKVTIKDKAIELQSLLRENEQIEFGSLIQARGDREEIRSEVIVSFITILERSRLGLVSIFQNESLGLIYIKVKSDISKLDIHTLTGFEPKSAGSKENIAAFDL